MGYYKERPVFMFSLFTRACVTFLFSLFMMRHKPSPEAKNMLAPCPWTFHGSIWELSILSHQFCCETKISLKKSILKTSRWGGGSKGE
jgi:hypothetical protein